ncbi:AraC family transcriptional regulator [Arenibacter algicola]|uniref:helix-turn-helix transcriptional regulator n=1 Tax=Arenibacter algicola TaxID=616991 RepID=UPI001C06853C|nr:AraC family transcriptional regulator [Arenibacter algicola]MBU2905929.1 AraC family transcriptional regulator [Arenibacter algicola]
MKIQVRDVAIQQIMQDLSKSFKTDLNKNDGEFNVELPIELGKGHIKGIYFDHGLGVLEFNFILEEKLILEYTKGEVHPLKLLFNRESSFRHNFDQCEESHEINRLENVILSSTPLNNHVFIFPPDRPISIFSIEINRKLFEEKISGFLMDMNEDLMKLFRDVNGTQIFYHKDFYSLDISRFLEEYSECNLADFLKTVYQEGKVYEILTHLFQQYLDDLNGSGMHKILRKATIEKIEMASKIIKSELDSMDNIVDLAKRVGVNQNKLQQGFKFLYKTSVNEYIQNYRLEKAKELLETTDLNITEITYKIGISSRSYFSKLFKAKYGISPKEYCNQFRKQAQ